MNPKLISLRAPRSPLNPGRVFRLTYSNVRPDDAPELFKCRDAIAFNEVSAALAAQGKTYGTTIFLYPDDTRRLADFPKFQPADVLVLTTRPPLDDWDPVTGSPRKKIWSTKTELEEILCNEFERYIAYCTRKHVELTDEGAGLLTPENRALWSHVEVYEYLGAKVQRHYAPAPVRPKSEHPSTIAFFLRVNQVPGINCDFVASFGMDGYGTLIWNRLIRTRYADWLTGPRFVMAELVYKKGLPDEPLTPEFADDDAFVEVRLLTTVEAGEVKPGPTTESSGAVRRAAAG